MSAYCCGLLLAFTLICGASAQLDCRTLNVKRSDSTPLSGATLDICQTTSSQCCSQAFLNEIRQEIAEELTEDLKDEVEGSGLVISNVTDGLATYLEEDFLRLVRTALPLSSLFGSHIADATVALANLLNRTHFEINATNPEVNTTQIILDMIDGIKMVLDSTESLSNETKACISNGISRIVNVTVVQQLGRDLEIIRRSYTFLARSRNFVRNFSRTYRRFVMTNVPKTCIRRAVELSFCGRCSRVLPPLCSNTCGALVRGCYAGFVTGLRSQFDLLWNTNRLALNAIKLGVANIISKTARIVDTAQILVLQRTCLMTGSRTKREAPTDSAFPSIVENLLNSTKGLFVYGSLGPRFCRPGSAELRYCRGTDSAPSNRRCDSDEICTSQCKCWNGESSQDRDTAPFTGSLVDDQENNPVVQVPKSEYEAVITELGTPVTAFLTSDDVATFLPEDANIPTGDSGMALTWSALLLVAMVLVQQLLV